MTTPDSPLFPCNSSAALIVRFFLSLHDPERFMFKFGTCASRKEFFLRIMGVLGLTQDSLQLLYVLDSRGEPTWAQLAKSCNLKQKWNAFAESNANTSNQFASLIHIESAGSLELTPRLSEAPLDPEIDRSSRNLRSAGIHQLNPLAAHVNTKTYQYSHRRQNETNTYIRAGRR